MSRTLTVQGTSNVLSINYYPPIELDPDSIYCLGLIGFHTYNSIPNIEKDINDTFKYGGGIEIKIPSGSYEITDIENYLQNQIPNIPQEEEERSKFLSIKPNNNTLKCEIKSKYDIDFSGLNSVGHLLGFSGKDVLKAGKLHQSDLPVEIIKVTSVRVDCNIVTGAYYDEKLSHTLFEFSPSVDPGFSINIEPHNIIYLPINVKLIDNITIKLLDQNGQLVNFRGEKILVRLELKKFK